MNEAAPEHLYTLYLLSHQKYTYLLQSNVMYVVFLLGQAIEQEECPIRSHSADISNISLLLVVLLSCLLKMLSTDPTLEFSFNSNHLLTFFMKTNINMCIQHAMQMTKTI